MAIWIKLGAVVVVVVLALSVFVAWRDAQKEQAARPRAEAAANG